MSETDAPQRMILAGGSIHNPNEPRHFMAIKPVPGRVRILLDGRVLAQSEHALRVIEVGRKFYDPVLYLPRADVVANLARTARQTECPLKGRASYFDLADESGRPIIDEIAWCYEQTFDFAAELDARIAFDATKVVIEEAPA